jgi:hypothetical protein
VLSRDATNTTFIVFVLIWLELPTSTLTIRPPMQFALFEYKCSIVYYMLLSTPYLLSKLSVSSQERKHVIICMCVNGIDFSTVSVILRLDFGRKEVIP